MVDRIVSLLPAATRMLYSLGAQDLITGVTHECRDPPEAASNPVVLRSALDGGLESGSIDSGVRRLLGQNRSIFELDPAALRRARPDLVIMQAACSVCAAHADQADQISDILGYAPQVHVMDPRTLGEIISSVESLGSLTGRSQNAESLVRQMRRRVDAAASHSADRRPRMLAVEWLEPLFTAGHHIPEMIEHVGGISMLAGRGERSRRTDADEVRRADPDMVILMPCGFDIKVTLQEYRRALASDPRWQSVRAVRNGNVYAVDANAYFSSAGIGSITGLEILARLADAGRSGLNVPAGSYIKCGWPVVNTYDNTTFSHMISRACNPGAQEGCGPC